MYQTVIISLRGILMLSIIICMNACRTHKKTTADPVEKAFYTSCYPIESLYVPSCKLDVSLGGQSLSLNGSIYIQSDSICYFSGKWLLFEIRGAIYRDSFVVVNYFQREYYRGKNDYLQKVAGYPVTPASLMALFTADRCKENFRNIEMNINAGDRTVKDITLNSGGRRFRAVYGEYAQYPQFMLPTVFDISAHDGEKPVRIKANFREILFNQPQEVKISVPSRYKLVILKQE